MQGVLIDLDSESPQRTDAAIWKVPDYTVETAKAMLSHTPCVPLALFIVFRRRPLLHYAVKIFVVVYVDRKVHCCARSLKTIFDILQVRIRSDSIIAAVK